MQSWLNNIDQLIQINPLLAFLVVFAAGVFVSFTPCVYPVIPLTLGYIGARSGGGHFTVTLVSNRFAGLNPLQRHRLVYEALGNLMKTEIHALSVRALTPEEL